MCVTVREQGVNVCVTVCIHACDLVHLHSISVGEKERTGERERLILARVGREDLPQKEAPELPRRRWEQQGTANGRDPGVGTH